MSAAEYIADLSRAVHQNTVQCKVLNADMIWSNQDVLIWQSDEFQGCPSFYPVYRYKNYYAFSVLHLILFKNNIHLNTDFVGIADADKYMYSIGSETIDTQIQRVGGAHPVQATLQDRQGYINSVVAAMKQDILAVEQKNPGKRHVILTGGKDSLNLLLLPWKSAPIALSADPNYDNTCAFIEENQLNCIPMRLQDYANAGDEELEILHNCSTANLAHWRWGSHLKDIAEENKGDVVFWLGQLADVYMTDHWKAYMVKPYQERHSMKFILRRFLRKLFRKYGHFLPKDMQLSIGQTIHLSVVADTWNKGASQQGAHLGFIRALTGCLVLSSYHGPEMQKVLNAVDLPRAVQDDIRIDIGQALLGRAVKYPSTNPGPHSFKHRATMHKPERFMQLLKVAGVKIVA